MNVSSPANPGSSNSPHAQDTPNLRDTFDREQARSRIRIALLLIPLTLLHILFFSFLIAALPLLTGSIALWELFFSRAGFLTIAGLGIAAAAFHYIFSRAVIMEHLHSGIPIEKPDPFDGRYRRLLNIVDELSIAAGIEAPEIHVVPSVAINAFALEAAGRRRLYVTQGCLSLLDRDELQGVIAHVLAHLSAGDIAVGTQMIALVNVIGFVSDASGTDRMMAVTGAPRGLLALLVLHLSSFFAALAAGFLCSVISRNRKLLADQLAVEITRHPEALAAALWKMQIRERTRLPIACDEVGLVCVVPPLYRVLDRSSGFFGSVFSVHPPVTARILRLSRYPLDVLESRLREPETPARRGPGIPPSRFLAWDGAAWQGPFLFAELAGIGWLTPTTWICAEGEVQANLVEQAPWFQRWLRRRAGLEPSPRHCPRCGGSLAYDYLEETRIERCAVCGGTTLDRDRIRKIRLRRSRKPAPDPSPAVSTEDAARPDLTCPRCRVTTARKFFSCERPIMIDECPRCRLIYLDPGELETLISRGS